MYGLLAAYSRSTGVVFSIRFSLPISCSLFWELPGFSLKEYKESYTSSHYTMLTLVCRSTIKEKNHYDHGHIGLLEIWPHWNIINMTFTCCAKYAIILQAILSLNIPQNFVKRFPGVFAAEKVKFRLKLAASTLCDMNSVLIILIPNSWNGFLKRRKKCTNH